MRNIFMVSLLLVSFILNASEFTAIVSNKEIGANDILELSLVLTDASSKLQPNLNDLTKYFTIYSNSQFSNIQIINGNKSSTIGWNIKLIPMMLGEITIPSISIETKDGILKTQPITIKVVKDAVSSNITETSMLIETELDKKSVYLHQPFVYTVKLKSKVPLYNVNSTELELNDAIVEKISSNNTYNQIVDGQHLYIFQQQYLVTPLKEGEINLPETRFTGEMQVMDNNVTAKNKMDSLFDNFFLNTTKMKSFSAVSEEKVVKIIPPVYSETKDNSDWLPLEKLFITQKIFSGEYVVGEPITRTIELKALGATAKTLPSLEKFHENVGFKVYAEPPVQSSQYSYENKLLEGVTTQTFSLIPLKEGEIVLPEILIKWWNVKTKKQAMSVLPEHKIMIKPQVTSINNINNNVLEKIENNKVDDTIYYILSGLLIMIFVLLLTIIYLIKNRNKNTSSIPTIKSSNNLTLNYHNIKDINKLNKPKMIYNFIQKFFEETWKLEKNLSLGSVIEHLKNNNNIDPERVNRLSNLFRDLSSSVYQNKSLDLEKLKRELIINIQKIKINRSIKYQLYMNKFLKGSEFKDLNPS